MLAIILGILKFIGLLLLGILGLLLALILLVLLVPVRYCACGSYYGGPKGTASVSWLLHILSCRVKYDGEPDMCIRVFGIRISGRRKPDSYETDDTKGSESTESTESTVRKTVSEAEAARDDAADSIAREQQKPLSGSTENQSDSQSLNGQKKRKARKHRKKNSFGNPIEKIRVTFQGICDKLKVLSEKKEQILAFINQEDNRRTFRLLKRQAGALLKHILPGTVKGRVRFGFDDPYITGQILTWVSPFYGLYARNLQLIPAFDKASLEGELNLRGRIRIGTLIAIAVRIYMDKNFRTLLKKWREA